MSHHPQQLGLFDPVQPHLPMRDVHPATDKQIGYARSLAAKTGAALPHSILHDRAALSAWIDKTKVRRSPGRFSNYPSAKQVQLAERLARLKPHFGKADHAAARQKDQLIAHVRIQRLRVHHQLTRAERWPCHDDQTHQRPHAAHGEKHQPPQTPLTVTGSWSSP